VKIYKKLPRLTVLHNNNMNKRKNPYVDDEAEEDSEELEESTEEGEDSSDDEEGTSDGSVMKRQRVEPPKPGFKLHARQLFLTYPKVKPSPRRYITLREWLLKQRNPKQ